MCFRPSAANLNQPVRCPVCGKINKPDATECIKCGATEAEMSAALQNATDPPASSKPFSSEHAEELRTADGAAFAEDIARNKEQDNSGQACCPAFHCLPMADVG